jgi:hypothetical protein
VRKQGAGRALQAKNGDHVFKVQAAKQRESLLFSAMKKASFVYRQRRFFQRNPSLRTGEIPLRGVKSLRGEIRWRGYWTDFISPLCASTKISPNRRFDFTVAQATISLRLYNSYPH